MKTTGLTLRRLGAALALCAVAAAVTAAPVTDSAWRTGSYPNLFTYHGIATSQQVQDKLTSHYNQLFINGNTDSQRIMRTVGNNQAYIEDINSGDIRSEGMSYGMMIAVQMNDQTTFDKLWRFAKQYMRNSDNSFIWHVSKTSPYGKINNDANAAPDAEEYIAMALFFAGNRWTSSEINYLNEAKATTAVLKSKLFNVNSDGGFQVLFSAAPAARWRFTDPSYHLPAFYELWQRWDVSGNADFWGNAAYQSRYYQFYGAHPVTGLYSEYTTFYPGITPGPTLPDGPNNVYGVMTVALAQKAGVMAPQDAHAPMFFSDAYRVINNMAMDFTWFSACCENESTETGISYFGNMEVTNSTRQLDWISKRTDLNGSYVSGYTLDGSPLSDANYKSGAHVAMNAVGTMSLQSDSLAKPFVQALWDQATPDGQYRYYDGLLHMLALLHASGQFQIYGPKSAGMFFDQSASSTSEAKISYKLRNSTAQAQSSLKAYYFITTENGKTPVVEAVSTPNVTGLAMQQISGNQWAVGLQYSNTLQPKQAVSQPDVFRVRYSDSSSFDKSNDFSQPKAGPVESADRVAVVNTSGKLLMGDAPDGVAIPAPGSYTIRVRARGATGQEIISVTVGGVQVASWTLTTNLADYVVSTTLGGGINVVYGNDGGTRDVIVDYADIGGVIRQAEAQTNNTGAWGNGRCGGGQFTEWMQCNGYIGFSAYR